jgi:hypothetical protein
MAPTFYGEGDLDDLGFPTGGAKFAFDPSSYFEDWWETNDNGRFDLPQEKRWVSSSLVNRSKWLKAQTFKWPVESYGSRAAGDARLPEATLVNEKYATSTGVLAPPTGLPSGLWWRARFQHAIEAQTIVAGDPKETSFLGDAYFYSIADFEEMSRAEYEAVRSYQKETYLKRRWPFAQMVESLNKFVQTH